MTLSLSYSICFSLSIYFLFFLFLTLSLYLFINSIHILLFLSLSFLLWLSISLSPFLTQSLSYSHTLSHCNVQSSSSWSRLLRFLSHRNAMPAAALNANALYTFFNSCCEQRHQHILLTPTTKSSSFSCKNLLACYLRSTVEWLKIVFGYVFARASFDGKCGSVANVITQLGM